MQPIREQVFPKKGCTLRRDLNFKKATTLCSFIKEKCVCVFQFDNGNEGLK